MKISDIIKNDHVISTLKAKTKDEVIEELYSFLVSKYLNEDIDLEEVVSILQERERLGSTGIGDGIAIPHGKLKNLDKDKLLTCFARSLEGVDYQSLDGKPSHLFFLLMAPDNSAGIHLKALARISRLFQDPSLRDSLMHAETGEEIYSILTRNDDRET